jgi:ABC-type Mn2+/Zn2+ transport system permease subunit
MVSPVDSAWLFAGHLFMAAAIGAASGAIGSFILLKRMALVSDALSHVALPGIAIALAFHADPFWGVIVTLLLAAVLIWWLESRSNLPTEALVALLFTTSLAIGILTIPDAEILESLFGAFPVLSPIEFAAIVGTALAALAGTLVFARALLYRIVSTELAQTGGIGRGYDLVLLLVFSTIVALGIKLVGTLLMGALTIIPAAIARHFALGMKRYVIAAAVLGGAIGACGAAAAALWSIRPGPTVILIGVAIFAVTLPFANRGK